MELDMSEELIEEIPAEESVEEIAGEYPEIARRYKAGEELTVEELDTIADVAISIVRDLLGFFDAANSPIDEYEGDEGELILDITAPDLAVLIGRHGRTLESLQTIVSLLVSRKLGFRYPVSIDVEGYKSRRHDKVVSMAHSAASRAVAQGRTVNLPPMSAYERRLVHIALRDDDRIDTHSEGTDPERRVVITVR
jgi:spoIIIJ-associated protein